MTQRSRHAPLRWGLLGTARINRAIMPTLRALPRHELVAVASRTHDRAEAYAAEHGIPQAYGTYDDLLAAPDVDAVYVPLPNHLHAPWTVAAARAGKHVLCEKPLALTVAEVDAIEEAARAAGVIVTEAFMYRHHAQTARIRQLVASGALGRVTFITAAFTFWLSRDGDPRLDPAQGGGSLWDVGCYPVSFARHVLGEEPTGAMALAEVGETGVDMNFAGQLAFPSAAVLQFTSGFRSHFRASLEILGTDALLEVPAPYKPGVTEQLFVRRGDVTETIVVTGEPLYAGEVEDLADAALEGRPPRVSLADSRGNVAALVALHEAARSGRLVALPREPR